MRPPSAPSIGFLRMNFLFKMHISNGVEKSLECKFRVSLKWATTGKSKWGEKYRHFKCTTAIRYLACRKWVCDNESAKMLEIVPHWPALHFFPPTANERFGMALARKLNYNAANAVLERPWRGFACRLYLPTEYIAYVRFPLLSPRVCFAALSQATLRINPQFGK